MTGSSAFDHAGLKAAALAEAVGKAHDFQRAGAMWQAADKAAFLQCGHKPVDPRFRAQIQRDLHFVERGRHPVARHARLNELKQLNLLFGQRQRLWRFG
jgi:hypothetical protein